MKGMRGRRSIARRGKRPPPGRGRRSEEREAGPRRRGGHDEESAQLVTGTYKPEPDGSGRLQPDGAGRAVYLPPEEVSGLRPGTRLTVRLELGRKGRVRGRVVAKGVQRRDRIIGIVRQQARAFYLVPEPEGPPLVVEPQHAAGASDGDAVQAHVLVEATGHRVATAAVDEVLGRPDEPKVQVEMLVRSQGLPMHFDEAALRQAAAAPDVDPDKALQREPLRQDLRTVPHVTIDGEDARDFDDAVSARPEGDGFRVWVSIADVASYVTDGSPLDQAARERGTSVYFPDRVIPMLPERLSNDLCSLKPAVPRLALTCELRVDREGRPHDVRVYPSLIESQARLTYNHVQGVLDQKIPGDPQRTLIQHLDQAARLIRARRSSRGAIDLELPEPYILIGRDGIAVHVRERSRLEAHRLIEDLMIAANEAVAEFLLARHWPALFRVHEEPDPLRLKALLEWSQTLGITFDVEAASRPRILAKVADELKKRPQGPTGQMLLLRSLAQARYDTENLGHYGLASRAYLHFTSPIRRYPDTLVHRALWALWHKKRELHGLDVLAQSTSQQERKAAEAERAVRQLMSCHVAQAHLGETFACQVTGVHTAGAFVRTRDPWVEGLLPRGAIGSVTGDYYDVIEREQALVGRTSGHRISVGDELQLRLAGVNTWRRQIDFELVERPRLQHRPGPPKPRGKPEPRWVSKAKGGRRHGRRERR